jgi:hypothetical protein
MGRIDYKQVKDIPFVSVLSHYGVTLTEKMISGDQKLQGYCPICHREKQQNPRKNQFQVTIKSQKNPRTENTFKCFTDVCGAHGTVVDFVVLMEKLVDYQNVDWTEVTRRRKEKDGWNWCPEEKLKLATQLLYTWFLENNDSQKPSKLSQVERSPIETAPDTSTNGEPRENRNTTWVEAWGKLPTYHKFFQENDYLKNRGISAETLEEFGVGYYHNPQSEKSANTRHIIFPIYNQLGDLLAYARRPPTDQIEGGKGKYMFPPLEFKREGKPTIYFSRALTLWNLHRAIKKGTQVYVVEGFFGCMNLWQNGHNAVALMGANLSERQCEILVGEFETATFVLDPDPAGRQKLKGQVVDKLLSKMPVRIIEPEKQVDLMNLEEISDLLK